MNPETPKTQLENKVLELPEPPSNPNPQPWVFLFEFGILLLRNYILGNWRDW
jgi:hypothetical protein